MAVLGLSLAGLGSYLLGLLCATLTGNTALRAEPTARFARKQCLTVQPLQLNKQTEHQEQCLLRKRMWSGGMSSLELGWVWLSHSDNLKGGGGIEQGSCRGRGWGPPLDMASLEELGRRLPKVSYLLFYSLKSMQDTIE